MLAGIGPISGDDHETSIGSNRPGDALPFIRAHWQRLAWLRAAASHLPVDSVVLVRGSRRQGVGPSGHAGLLAVGQAPLIGLNLPHVCPCTEEFTCERGAAVIRSAGECLVPAALISIRRRRKHVDRSKKLHYYSYNHNSDYDLTVPANEACRFS